MSTITTPLADLFGCQRKYYLADPAEAEEHRKAVRAQWTGDWFRRTWLGPADGWLGEKCMWIEPQPWAIIGGSANEDQTRMLIRNIDQKLRQVFADWRDPTQRRSRSGAAWSLEV